MSLQTPRPIRAVTAFTTRQHAVTKNANPITETLRRNSPRFSQYVPDGSSPAAMEALARLISCRRDQDSCTSSTNEHSVNSCTALRLEIASADSAFVASLTLSLMLAVRPAMCRIGVEGLTSGGSMTHAGGTAVSGCELNRVSAACSIAAAVKGASRRANSAPSSRHSLSSATTRAISLPVLPLLGAPDAAAGPDARGVLSVQRRGDAHGRAPAVAPGVQGRRGHCAGKLPRAPVSLVPGARGDNWRFWAG